MCGFAGELRAGSAYDDAQTVSRLKKMGQAIRHRGPDDSGIWCDPAASIGIVHRRLSIIELSPAGHQPMESASARYVIAFNGEIYNHLELRQAMTAMGCAPRWRGHSDTETLLAAIEVWGISDAIKRCVGMFAIALWDRQIRSLTLIRDRLGEKPLYYGWQGDGQTSVFLFGSELKALRAHPGFNASLRRDALCLFVRYNYIPAPYTIYEGVHKLLPGSQMTVALDRRDTLTKRYWAADEIAVDRAIGRKVRTDIEVVDELEVLLKNAIAQQMVADVPLGAFLSGGVDSSLVVALMQAQATLPVRTFTIGFNEEAYNEAAHAKAVAAHLGTEHTELYVSPHQALDVIPLLPTMFDEPFADSSQIPTFLVSQLAREHVTVSLSGDAGDELFCGYHRYRVAFDKWGRLSRCPAWLRRCLARGLTALSLETWNSLTRWLPPTRSGTLWGDKLRQVASVLASHNIDELYRGLVSHWFDPGGLIDGGHEPPSFLTEWTPDLKGLDHVERMMALDMVTYLPDDILAKVDRAAMFVSLETRVPMLDHRVVEFAWGLPIDRKFRGGSGKWALRQVLYKHVPKALVDRPKMGFGVPIDTWLRGPLRDWAENLLGASRLRQEGYFNPAPIRRKWLEHIAGRQNWAYHLWDILMFQAWLEHQAN